MEAPLIYALACNKVARMADFWDLNGAVSGWRYLRRHLNDWELDQMAWFLGILEAFQLRSDRDDFWHWTLGNSGDFLIIYCFHRCYFSVGRQVNRVQDVAKRWVVLSVLRSR